MRTGSSVGAVHRKVALTMQTVEMRVTNKLDALVDFLSKDDRVRALCQEPLPPEYSYASLSTMLLDAIFSIGVRYEQVKAVVARHEKRHQYDSRHFGEADPYPLPKLIREGREGTFEQFAEKLGNRGRTSTHSGILKAEAVILAAEALVQHGIVDLPSWCSSDETSRKAAERDFLHIKGQGTGVSWDYFLMLAGDVNKVKPDRMVVRYVEDALERKGLSPKEAGKLLIAATAALRGDRGYPSTLTARQLDSAVWTVVRSPRQDRRPKCGCGRKTVSRTSALPPLIGFSASHWMFDESFRNTADPPWRGSRCRPAGCVTTNKTTKTAERYDTVPGSQMGTSIDD